MKIKYSIITRGSINVEVDTKNIILYGEVVLEPSSFYIDINSIKKWEPPFENEVITDELKSKIIKGLLEESRIEGNVRLYFE